MLRKLVIASLLSVALASPGWAQDHKVEISPFFGYTLSEGFTVNPVVIEGNVYDKINPTSGLSYGFMFNVFVNENMQVGFLFDQQDSNLEAKGPTVKTEFADLKVQNYHAIFTYNFGYDDATVRPFLMGGIGATGYKPGTVTNTGTTINNNTRFSTTWAGGVKVYPTPKIGFLAMARWTPTYMKSDPAGIWCNPWWPGGCWQLVETDYSNQFQFSGGITFRF